MLKHMIMHGGSRSNTFGMIPELARHSRLIYQNAKNIMPSLKQESTELSISSGAINALVANAQRLQEFFSSDPTNILPNALSGNSYAVSLGKASVPDTFGKVTRGVFGCIMYMQNQKIHAGGEMLCERLKKEGFTGMRPNPNGWYRRENLKKGQMTPGVSHRYAALSSGLACAGWIGKGRFT